MGLWRLKTTSLGCPWRWQALRHSQSPLLLPRGRSNMLSWRPEGTPSGQGLRGTEKKTAGPWDPQLHFEVISGNKNRSLVTAGAVGRGSGKKNLRRWPALYSSTVSAGAHRHCFFTARGGTFFHIAHRWRERATSSRNWHSPPPRRDLPWSSLCVHS